MSHWYMHPCTNQISNSKSNPLNADKIYTRAKEILKQEESFLSGDKAIFSNNRATNEWLKTVFKGGPITDRINGAAIIVQENPLRCLPFLDKLIAFVNPAKKRDCIQAIDVLYTLWIKYLLPSSRELLSFNKRPLNYLETNKEKVKKKKKKNFAQKNLSSSVLSSNDLILLHWIFEEELKNRFHRFVKSLEHVLMTDTLESNKRKVSNMMFEFIQRKPEARKTLLKLIVNKIGDPNKKLASNIVHNLQKLVQSKSKIKLDILEEVEALLFRPNIAERAQYYSICFLNQLLLSKDDVVRPMVMKLLHIYAAFFRAAVKDKEMNERLLSALLTGFNRAVPFVKGSLSEIDEHINTLFLLVHTTGLGVSLQTLMVLFHIISHRDELKERYYSALYRKLLDPSIFTSSSKEALLLHLLYKSLMADSEPSRVKAFFKRLLQICCAHQDAGFVCGILILIAKIALPNPRLIILENKTIRSSQLLEDEDDEEYFEDMTDSDEESQENVNSVSKERHSVQNKKSSTNLVSWDHRQLHNPNSIEHSQPTTAGYNPSARNPRFANVDNECFWELYALKWSSHPSVAIFADKIIRGEPLDYTGDPFRDFSINHFLERFVFKNPKIKGPTASKVKSTSRQVVPLTGAKSLSVNSDAYLKLDEEKIPEEEKFFHRYFKFIDSKGKFKSKKKGKEDSDEEDSEAESVSDSEFDEYLDKYEKQLDVDHNLDNCDDDELSDLVMSDDDDDDLLNFDDDSQEEEENNDEDEFDSGDDEEEKEVEQKKNNRKRSLSSSDEDEEESEPDFDEDESDDDDFSLKTHGSKKHLNQLFVSADRTGDLFDNQESHKERKQRVWEDKRFGRGFSKKSQSKKRKR